MIRKAMLPVAGFGTRCLHASKAIPKEVITIVDRPVIPLAVSHATYLLRSLMLVVILSLEKLFKRCCCVTT